MDNLLVFLIQLTLILVATRFGSYVAIKLRLAPVLGELVAGIALGPTLFGLLLPGLQRVVFPGPGSVPNEMLQSTSWIGLIFLMFIGGLDVDTGTLRKQLRPALLIALGALACTLAVGFGVAGILPPEVFPRQGQLEFRAFVALALAITAIPVLIKILGDLELLTTPLGTTLVAAGVVVDTVGWILLTSASALSMLVGGTLGARLGGMGPWASLGAGVGVVAHGAMGLVAAGLGHGLGLISSGTYAMLVVVAVTRTLLAAVGLQWLRPRITGGQ